jgi:membrane protease YdiL (CAAX protease family)
VPQWITDTIIGLAYMAIPLGLVLSARARSFRLAKRVLYLSAAFIVLCGGGHFRHAWLEFHGRCATFDPFMDWWNLGTAAASVLFVVVVLTQLGLYVTVLELPAGVKLLKELVDRKAKAGHSGGRHSEDGP